VIGALSEWVVDKLIIDFPEQFHRCIVQQMRCSKEEIEMRLNNNSIIEYRRRGSLFECVSLHAVKDNKVRKMIMAIIFLNAAQELLELSVRLRHRIISERTPGFLEFYCL
jgi:hypothetical protein